MQPHIISEPHVWLASGRGAIVWITLVHVWGVLPLVSLIFLAGLQSIPEEVYSASAVDGAGPFRQFRHITLPLLRPSMAVALTVGTLLAITIFDEIYVLNGTALNTRSILIQVYNTTFAQADFAHGTALAFLLAARPRCSAGSTRWSCGGGRYDVVAGGRSRCWRSCALLILVARADPDRRLDQPLHAARRPSTCPPGGSPRTHTEAYHDLLGGNSTGGGGVTDAGPTRPSSRARFYNTPCCPRCRPCSCWSSRRGRLRVRPPEVQGRRQRSGSCWGR